ncbi:MAG TPA: helix-turn-helix transcriptional regulator [Thermoleophilia bacterium]|nr:helix-turn-helix transcriptional regulator [Thermoleophilia bacterium]
MNRQASAISGNVVLRALPPQFWNSWDVQQAALGGSPGEVIALARQAHGLSQGELGALAGFSQSAISRLEAGGNLGFDIRVLRSLARLLGIPPRLLGLADESSVPQFGAQALFPGADRLAELAGLSRPAFPIDNKSVVNVYMAAAFGGPSTKPGWAEAEDRPIDPDIMHRLMVVRRLVNEADAELGPAFVTPAVAALYRLVDHLHRGAAGGMRRRMLDIAASYAEFHGWLCQQLGDLHGAVAWTRRALQQAEAADHPELVAYVRVRLAQFAEAGQDGEQVVGMARAARREPGLSPQVQAIALHQEARGHALAGNVGACMQKLDEARTVALPETAQWGDEYRVGCFYDQTHLLTQQSACLLDLGRARDAIASYGDRHGSELLCRWQRAVHTAKLARAYALCGEVDRAAALGSKAAELGDGIGSALVQQELSKLDAWCPDLAISDGDD